jgi:hypothetical protein
MKLNKSHSKLLIITFFLTICSIHSKSLKNENVNLNKVSTTTLSKGLSFKSKEKQITEIPVVVSAPALNGKTVVSPIVEADAVVRSPQQIPLNTHMITGNEWSIPLKVERTMGSFSVPVNVAVNTPGVMTQNVISPSVTQIPGVSQPLYQVNSILTTPEMHAAPPIYEFHPTPRPIPALANSITSPINSIHPVTNIDPLNRNLLF